MIETDYAYAIISKVVCAVYKSGASCAVCGEGYMIIKRTTHMI